MRLVNSYLLLSLGLALATGCGGNVFQSSEPKDPAEDATLDLEKNNPGGAISILTAALANNPGNTQLLSILSLAYAERAGIDPLSFALNLAEQQSQGAQVPAAGSAPTTGNFAGLFSILPPATASNLSDIQTAVATITQIPVAERQEYDTFKYALFQTASMMLSLKSLDTNHDGIIEPSELLAGLTSTFASTLLGQLASAAGALGANPSDTSSQQLQKAVTQYQSQITAADPGGTPQQQLAAFIQNNGSSVPAGTTTGTATTSLLTGDEP